MMRMTVPPNVEYDPKTRTLSVGGRRARHLSDNEIRAIRAMAPNLFDIEMLDGGGVDILSHGEVLCWAPDLGCALQIIKALYAAALHTYTQEEIEQRERGAYRRGVTIQPGSELRGEEIRNLPIGSVIAANGRLFDRKADRWCDANGNLVPTPERAWFVAFTKEPYVLQDDDDDDFDEDDFEELHDCCEQCGTDWKEANE